MSDWLRMKRTAAAIREYEAASGGSAELRESPQIADESRSETQVFDRGDGQDASGPPELLPSFVAWFAPQWLPAVTQALTEAARGASRRPRQLTPADAEVVLTRKGQNRSLSQVVDERGCPPFMAFRALGHGLTGRAPEVWEREFGKNWLDGTAIEFQRQYQLAAEQAAAMVAVLPASATKRHIIAVCKQAGATIRASWEAIKGSPLLPTNEGPGFTLRRLERAVQGLLPGMA